MAKQSEKTTPLPYVALVLACAVPGAGHAYLGRVTSVFPTGSNDVYVVRHNDEEILVPALEWVVLAIDLAAGRMRVDLPEGL